MGEDMMGVGERPDGGGGVTRDKGKRTIVENQVGR
jgi:hypothetical protein